MKVVKNALSEDLCFYSFNEIKKLKDSPVWQSSTAFWNEGIRECISGSCIVTSTSDEIKKMVLDQIQNHLPSTVGDISVMFYIWQPYSGISKHTDPGYSFAATIYLNEYWDVDWGGIFLYYNKKIDWEESEEEYMTDHNNWKVVVPEFGTMVLNNDETLHMVTPLSPLSPELRYTIQIWGHS